MDEQHIVHNPDEAVDAMSTLASDRNRSKSLGSSRSRASAKGKIPAQIDVGNSFEPCAATASMFLFAQGTSILCIHHDTLALDRRFQRHTEDVLLIAVDNASDASGRWVVSYDAGRTAIVWDLFSGDEVARFSSYEVIRVAAWLRNGNVAFGNEQGEVILFDPRTSEHVSARTIFDPITALAPSADCRTYAIGYMNGSVLIANIQPTFIIRSTLTTSRGPSPIATLAWHGSSQRQKADMLATQTFDGDSRVWSIAKDPFGETPKIVRKLERSNTYQPGPNWLAWSKNGRIVQHSEGSTAAWDVRTKHVSYEAVPTIDGVRGIAIHGPTATLFTLGRDHSVQQYDLNPPCLVKSVSHMPIIPPPSPPVSIEESVGQSSIHSANVSASGLVPLINDSEDSSENEPLSPLQKIAREMDQMEKRRRDRSGAMSVASSAARSRATSITSSQPSYMRPQYTKSRASVSSRGTTNDGTQFSMGSSLHTSGDTVSISTGGTPSIASSRNSRPSRLRKEYVPSPVDTNRSLFAHTSARLSDVPHKFPQPFDDTQLTASDLRKQMLSVVFGWKYDIEELIRDELAHQQAGSQNAVILSKWLGDADDNVMSSIGGHESMAASDWMLLALSGINGQSNLKSVWQGFVQRLLAKGEVHTAATILLGLGDHDDAVELYLSHKYYMEAVLLTCLVFSEHWQRIAELLKKWGKHEVAHGEQTLAIRLFACTGQEPAEDWTSPRAQKATFAEQMQSLDHLAAPSSSAGGSRLTQKNASLKLITSFGEKDVAKARLGDVDPDRTPMNRIDGITPIDSAVMLDDPESAMLTRPKGGNRTATPGSYHRARLPSIGETPNDATPKTTIKTKVLDLPLKTGNSMDSAPLTLSSARYDRSRESSRTPLSETSKKNLPSPAQGAFTALREQSRSRNGSRDRKPDGLRIDWPPMETVISGEYMSPTGSEKSRWRQHQRSNTDEPLASPPLTAESLTTQSTSMRSPLKTGRSIDNYISSLEEANYYAKQQRAASRSRAQSREPRGSGDRRGRGRSSSRKPTTRDSSEDRAKSAIRYIKPAKRSPSSPIPMSPDDLLVPISGTEDDSSVNGALSPMSDVRSYRSYNPKSSSSRLEPKPRASSRHASRRNSPERKPGSRAGSKLGARASSRAGSRRQSPDTSYSRAIRGRSNLRSEGSGDRSPSSPLPMLPNSQYSEEEREAREQRRIEDRKRYRSRQRSTSRVPREPAVREPSPDRYRARSTSRRPKEKPIPSQRERRDRSPAERSLRRRADSYTSTRSGESRQQKSEMMKELAARDLEERRNSLARRPSVPQIPHPKNLSPGFIPFEERTVDSDSDFKSPNSVYKEQDMLRSKTVSPSSHYRSTKSNRLPNVPMGLPQTPRAMRHPKYMGQESKDDIPNVPEIPSNLSSLDTSNLNNNGNSNGNTRHNHNSPDDTISPSEAADTLAPLPSSSYAPPSRQKPPPRSASAPIPDDARIPQGLPNGLPAHPGFRQGLPTSQRRGVDQMRMASNRNSNIAIVSIDETLNAPSANIITVGEPEEEPTVLPELQHLAQPQPPPPPPVSRQFGYPQQVPPPPPPAPVNFVPNPPNYQVGADGVGVINIAIETLSRHGTPAVDQPSPASSTVSAGTGVSSNSTHRGRNTSDSFSSKIRERMRSGSRSRTKSPGNVFDISRGASPYESIPRMVSPPVPQQMDRSALGRAERHPREVRANITPEMAKLGITDGTMI